MTKSVKKGPCDGAPLGGLKELVQCLERGHRGDCDSAQSNDDPVGLHLELQVEFCRLRRKINVLTIR